MKSFAPSFNISVLNLSLKSGIWAGVSAVSFASGAVTVANNWSYLQSQTKIFYQETIESYILDPLLNFHVSLYDGYSEIFGTYKNWYQYIQNNSNSINEFIKKSLSLENITEGYGAIKEEISLQRLKSFFNFFKTFLNSDILTTENIRWFIHFFVSILKHLDEIISQLSENLNKENLDAIQKLLKEILKNEKFKNLKNIIPELIRIISKFPDFLEHIKDEDIKIAEKYTTPELIEEFRKNVDKLLADPIMDKTGEDLKEEIMRRLFPEWKGQCGLDKKGLVGSVACHLQETFNEFLQDSAKCEKGKKCKAATTTRIIGGVGGGLYHGAKGLFGGFLGSFLGDPVENS